MKQFHWDKLAPNKFNGTVWQKKELDIEVYKKDVDFSEFEDMFNAKAVVKENTDCILFFFLFLFSFKYLILNIYFFFKKKKAEQKPKEDDKKKPDLITVLDSKRSYNCGNFFFSSSTPFGFLKNLFFFF